MTQKHVPTQVGQPTRSWAFTFGSSHTHPETGENLSNYYVVIDEPDYERARKRMFNMFGSKWCVQEPFDESFVAKTEAYKTYELYSDRWPKEVSQERRKLLELEEVLNEVWDITERQQELLVRVDIMFKELKKVINP